MTGASLEDPAVQAVLKRLHAIDARQPLGFIPAVLPGMIRNWRGQPPSAAEEAHRFRKMAIGLGPASGRLAYLTARAIEAERIVEFGTSFGISTIYLAAALRDQGRGVVIGSELEPSKIKAARRNVADAGLTDFVDIRGGDARETLVDPGGSIDLVLLDGWKDLYLPVLRLLERNLRSGAVVLADNVTMFRRTLAPYVAYVGGCENGYQSVTLEIGSGLEYSLRL